MSLVGQGQIKKVSRSKKQWRLPRQLVIFLMVLGFFGVFILIPMVIYEPGNFRAQQELEKDFQTITQHPSVTQIAYSSGHKGGTDLVTVKADYLTTSDIDSTLQHYDAELTGLGWQFSHTEHNSFAKLVYYCKGEYRTELDFEDSASAKLKPDRYFHIRMDRGFDDCDGSGTSFRNALLLALQCSLVFTVSIVVAALNLWRPSLIRELGIRPGYTLLIQCFLVGLVAGAFALFGYYNLWQYFVR
jgi:hypothetical protein